MVTVVKALPEVCWLTAIVAVPLAVNPYFIEPFVWPRTLILLVLASLLVVFAVGRELAGGLELWGKFLRRPLVIASLALLAAQAASTYFSTNPYISVWGRAGRNNGLLTFAACTVMFLAVVRYADKGARERLLIGVLVSALLVAVCALVLTATYEGRVAGTLGNPIFLGAFMLVPIFIAASYANKNRLMWPVYLVLLWALFAAVSRGPALGLMVGSGLMFWKGMRAVAVVGIVVGAAVFVARMGPGYTDNMVKRVEIWGEGYQTASDAPMFRNVVGYGPDMWLYEGEGMRGITTYAGVAHNVPIQVFVTTGIVGLTAFLALWGAAAVAAHRSTTDWFFPALSALFVESMFGLTMVAILLMFWITLGSIESEVPTRCEST